MNLTRVGMLKDKLSKRKHQVAVTLRHLEREQEHADENNDWLDEATFRSRVRLLDRLTDWYITEAAKIDKALARIDARAYGLCRGCHEDIEPARLEAFPEAEFCVACQDMREKVERV
jgi:RNA polymerase-binding transcription factor DksA